MCQKCASATTPPRVMWCCPVNRRTGKACWTWWQTSVTLAELEYGLHRKGQPARLRNALTQVLLRVDVMAWDEDVATCYGEFCATLEAQGIHLSDFDMMIAAHAIALDVTLASRDKAFAQLPTGVGQRLRLEVW
jgi:tRNA(fMet)-specific endonuclease VapC